MAAPTSTPSETAPTFGDPSTFLSGDGLQAAVNNMVEMGFPRDQVLRAMRASFNNADRAVEYLMTVRGTRSIFYTNFLILCLGNPSPS